MADKGVCCMACSAAGRHATVNGKRVLNMASCDFLGIAGDPVIKVGQPLHSRHMHYLSMLLSLQTTRVLSSGAAAVPGVQPA